MTGAYKALDELRRTGDIKAIGLGVNEAKPIADALDRGDFGANLLLSFEPSPGTLMYLGWTRQMSGPDTWDLSRHRRMAEGLFLKFSYLYRL